MIQHFINGIAMGALIAVASRRLWKGGYGFGNPTPTMDEWFWLGVAVTLALISLN